MSMTGKSKIVRVWRYLSWDVEEYDSGVFVPFPDGDGDQIGDEYYTDMFITFDLTDVAEMKQQIKACRVPLLRGDYHV